MKNGDEVNKWIRLKQSVLRISAVLIMLAAILLIGYGIWKPGLTVTDGRNDLKSNGIWLQHGWLGGDAWFKKYNRYPTKFRDPNEILKLRALLEKHHISDVFPHLCPCLPNGEIADIDQQQLRQFLQIMDIFRVIPWVGGVLDVHVFPDSKQWREKFIHSIVKLLEQHPGLAGIHINIEPMPSGYLGYLTLLKELKNRLPDKKILSVAAYPPPTIWQPVSDVHWEKTYFHKVSRSADQMVVMMYDTGIRFEKIYQELMTRWTIRILEWSQDVEILLGLPAYDDKGVAYHDPDVENLKNALTGIHKGLDKNVNYQNYKGVSIYSEWETDADEWAYFKKYFLK